MRRTFVAAWRRAVGTALAGVLVAGLASGVIERLGLPAVAVFLGLGAALGPFGLGLIDFDLRSPALMAIAIRAFASVKSWRRTSTPTMPAQSSCSG